MPPSIRATLICICLASGALALAPLAALAATARQSAARPSVDWRGPKPATLVGGELEGNGCRLKVDARRGVRKVAVSVYKLRAKLSKVPKAAGRVAVRKSGANRYRCGWNTTQVTDGFYVLSVRVTDRRNRVDEDEVIVYVGNRRLGRRPKPGASSPPPPAVDPGAVVSDVTGGVAQDVPILASECKGTPAPYPARLHSESPTPAGDVGRAFVDPNGCALLLKGFNIFPVFPSTPPAFAWSEQHYRSIKEKGFNAVRMLLPWKIYEPQRGQFQNLDLLDRAIQQARNAGLYVIMLTIIMDHWNEPPAWTGWTKEQGHEAKVPYIERESRGWLQEVAKRYKDNPVVAAYDVANEIPGADQNKHLRFLSTLYGYVREVDPEKILAGSPTWGNFSMAPKFADPANLKFRRNVAHSWHDYFAGDGNASRVFDGYNATYGGNSGNQVYDGVKGYPNTGDAPDFEAQVQTQTDFAKRAGVPVFIGEFGINPRATNAMEWARQKIAIYNRLGISRTWWLYDQKNSGFAPKDAGGNWLPIADALQ